MILNIEEILDAVNIADVVSSHVDLKKKGVNYTGCCPFHDENTPSFFVSPNKEIYKCFGCGAAGNAVKFLMEYQKLSFPEALKLLAKQFNVKVKEEKVSDEDLRIQEQKRNKEASLKIIHNKAAEFYHQNFIDVELRKWLDSAPEWKHASVKDMPDYQTIVDFKIGFATKNWQDLYNYLRAQGFKHDFIIESGLVIENDKKLYDRFRNRIMFPIMDRWGDCVGFSGRDLSGAKETPKYLNSPESEIYNKSKIIFGLFQSKDAIRKMKSVHIVEGNFDVFTLFQIGASNTICTNGTSLSPGHVKTLKKFTDNFILIYDGDEAGRSAMIKNGKICLQEGVIPLVVLLPEGEDPDSFFTSTNAVGEQLTI